MKVKLFKVSHAAVRVIYGVGVNPNVGYYVDRDGDLWEEQDPGTSRFRCLTKGTKGPLPAEQVTKL